MNTFYNRIKEIAHSCIDYIFYPIDIEDSIDTIDTGDSEVLEVAWNWFNEYVNIYNINDINQGAQQLVINLDHYVIKISNSDIGKVVNGVISQIEEPFKHLFIGYKFIEKYKDFYIYIQKEVIPYDFDEEYQRYEEGFVDYLNERSPLIRTIFPSILEFVLLKYEFNNNLNQLCEFSLYLKKITKNWDLKSDNWGIINNKIQIFDPIF